MRQIARETESSLLTISRKLKRNRCTQNYRLSETQESYQKRSKRCRRRLQLAKGELRDIVVRLLSSKQWSPEQISMRLELERGALVVNYATIYRALSLGYMKPTGKRRRNNFCSYNLIETHIYHSKKNKIPKSLRVLHNL